MQISLRRLIALCHYLKINDFWKAVRVFQIQRENFHRVLLPAAQFIVVAISLALAVSCFGALFGFWPWLDLTASINGTQLRPIGQSAQLFVTAFMLVLLVYLPSNLRMAALERSHRSFTVGMEDVARAYAHAHAADRAKVFTLSSEFEDMRQRMEYMRAHPHFQDLEPEILQLAAQMSLQTRDLARIYADEKISRAKSFLRQRQEEVQLLNNRLDVALQTSDELRRWLTDIEIEERHASVQMKRLEADLRDILPKLGYDFDLDEPAREPPHKATQTEGDAKVLVMQKTTQRL